jgi:hypothetical protein
VASRHYVGGSSGTLDLLHNGSLTAMELAAGAGASPSKRAQKAGKAFVPNVVERQLPASSFASREPPRAQPPANRSQSNNNIRRQEPPMVNSGQMHQARLLVKAGSSVLGGGSNSGLPPKMAASRPIRTGAFQRMPKPSNKQK